MSYQCFIITNPDVKMFSSFFFKKVLLMIMFFHFQYFQMVLAKHVSENVFSIEDKHGGKKHQRKPDSSRQSTDEMQVMKSAHPPWASTIPEPDPLSLISNFVSGRLHLD